VTRSESRRRAQPSWRHSHKPALEDELHTRSVAACMQVISISRMVSDSDGLRGREQRAACRIWGGGEVIASKAAATLVAVNLVL
jgi:hypothetical protein